MSDDKKIREATALDSTNVQRLWCGLSFAEWLVVIVAVLGVLHHTDHVLRWDHSGWPFKPEVTPFTYSLLVYPLLLVIFALRSRPWARVVIMAFLFVAIQSAHVFAETPYQQYYTWAAGVSSSAYAAGHPNLLHVASPVLGVLAAAISIALSLALLAALIALIAEAKRQNRASTAL